jgi:hypothetical protein
MNATLILVVTGAIASAACSEIPQDARKPFASASDSAMHTGAKFNGDRVLYDKTLRERAGTQDEYRMLAK